MLVSPGDQHMGELLAMRPKGSSQTTGYLLQANALTCLRNQEPEPDSLKSQKSLLMREDAQFGYVHDEQMLLHKCGYDSTMLECPQRIELIYDRLQNDGLLKFAYKIPSRKAEDWELFLNHPKKLVDSLERLKTENECEEFCKGYELLWLCPQTMQSARIAVGTTIDMLKANFNGTIGNGFALVRPPGHHSYSTNPQGYCVFNNVAIAAKYAVEKLCLKKVLILDIDYHCGNGTYHSLKNDERFLFVNFHAYHYGAFWPFDSEYDYDSPATNHISIPLNSSMNTEFDYMAAFQILVLPIAKEFSPELVLISVGFDAAYCDQVVQIGDLGQAVKAHGYGHFVRFLDKQWPNKVLAVLEGGYLPESYVECASQLTRGLQRLPLPNISMQKSINTSMVETIWNALYHHSKRWKSAAVALSKLQQQQISNNLLMYVPPTEKIYVGHKFRIVWDRIKELHVSRTRGWILPEKSDADGSAKLTEAIKRISAYVAEYDYKKQIEELNEDIFMKKMVWTNASVGEAYLLSASPTVTFHNEMMLCLESADAKYLTIDMAALREAEKKLEYPNDDEVDQKRLTM